WAKTRSASERVGKPIQVSDLERDKAKVFDVSHDQASGLPSGIKNVIAETLRAMGPDSKGPRIVLVAKSQAEMEDAVQTLKSLEDVNVVLLYSTGLLRTLLYVHTDVQIHVDFVYGQLKSWNWAGAGIQILTDHAERWTESFTANVQILLILGSELHNWRAL